MQANEASDELAQRICGKYSSTGKDKVESGGFFAFKMPEIKLQGKQILTE